MHKRLTSFLVLFLLAWVFLDKILLGSFLSLNAIDYMQTRYIEQSDFRELNPLVEEFGAPIYFATVTSASVWVVHKLPKYRRLLLGLLVGFQLSTTGRNVRVGIGFSF